MISDRDPLRAAKREEQQRLLPLLVEAHAYVKEQIDFMGGCDHDVGLCCCADIRLCDRLAEEIKQLQSG